jgi:hypothetical protein
MVCFYGIGCYRTRNHAPDRCKAYRAVFPKWEKVKTMKAMITKSNGEVIPITKKIHMRFSVITRFGHLAIYESDKLIAASDGELTIDIVE